MSDAFIGNTRTLARIDEAGTVTWAAFPYADSQPVFQPFRVPAADAGAFQLQPAGEYQVQRRYLGETGVLETRYTTAGGKALVLDFLPLRPSATNGEARVPHDRLVRIVEGVEGEVRFQLRLTPRPEGSAPSLALDPNGLIASGERTSLLIQTEAEVHMGTAEVVGAFSLKPRERRHFVLTLVEDPDPEVPEMKATEPEWELDGTFDYWLVWARFCPFQGVQRSAMLKLASIVRTLWVSPAHQAMLKDDVYASPYAMIAPAAMSAWGWKDELGQALGAWRPHGDSAQDRAHAAWLLVALAEGQQTGLIEATLIVPHWPALQAMATALAASLGAEATPPADRLAAWAGLRGAHALADELMLEGNWAAAVREGEARLAQAGLTGPQAVALGLGEEAAEDAASRKFSEGDVAEDGLGACWAIRQELARGAYLQARRMMDRLLSSYDPLGRLPAETAAGPDLGTLAFVLWTAAEIYLQGAPEAGRVELPGDLGD